MSDRRNNNHGRVALITGISGQDGTYLTDLLVGLGFRVVGLSVNPANAKSKLESVGISNIEVFESNLKDEKQLCQIIQRVHPSEIYNLAAYSSGARMFEDPIEVAEINGFSIIRILEAIRHTNNEIRFCQASSSEIFGDARIAPQDENTCFNPRSPYGAAKLYAHNILNIYKKKYGMFCCSAILFNHESPRRSLEFVTRKITCGVAKIKLGIEKELRLGNLDAKRDWGFAGDYVKAMSLMLRQDTPDNYVVATGVSRSVREFCSVAFEYVGLDYRNFVKEDASVFRKNENVDLVGDPKKANEILKWKPSISFNELVKMMVDNDLHQLKK